MTEMPSKYKMIFRPGDLLSLGIHLPGRGFAEDAATVIFVDHAGMMVELCGNGFPSHVEISSGTKGVVTRVDGRTVYQCRTILLDAVTGRSVKLQFAEEPEIKERREYARLDVKIRVHYDLPLSQDMGQVLQEWEVLKNCSGRCPESRSLATGSSLLLADKGHSRVNLSGSGLRFKINDCLSYGTLLHLYILLPGERAEHIHAIGAIVRTKELLPEMEYNEYYSTSMSFRMIDIHDRARLMEHILNEQRKTIL